MERRGESAPFGNRMSDRALVRAMRRQDRRALREFFERFYAPLHDHAAGMGVAGGLRDEAVTEFLDDMALRLMEPDGEMPRHLLGYLVKAFRHRIANRGRSDGRRLAAHAAAAEADGLPDHPVASVCSEGTLRASRGPGLDDAGPSPLRRRIAAIIDAEVTDDERRLLSWLAAQVGASEIARRLGINRNAAKSRIYRLRRRLRHVAVRHALVAHDRRELLDFFRALDRLEPQDRALLAGEPPPPPQVA